MMKDKVLKLMPYSYRHQKSARCKKLNLSHI